MTDACAELANLRNELEQWDAEGQRPRFWLRDDDLIQASPRLEVMSRVLERFRLRSLLAIIPALMKKDVASAIDAQPFYVPCQHGLAHQNYEPPGIPKAEFGPARSATDSIADITAGRRILAGAFGDRLAPVFVPP